MCYMFYVASDNPLPAVSQDGRYPDLTINPAHKDVSRLIRRILKSTHIYAVGSWQGCSCGFFYEDRNELETTLAQLPDESVCHNARVAWQSGYNSVTSLGRYLADIITLGSLQLYVAWAGYEGKPVRFHTTVTPAYFGGQSFHPPEEDSLLAIVAV